MATPVDYFISALLQQDPIFFLRLEDETTTDNGLNGGHDLRSELSNLEAEMRQVHGPHLPLVLLDHTKSGRVFARMARQFFMPVRAHEFPIARIGCKVLTSGKKGEVPPLLGMQRTKLPSVLLRSQASVLGNGTGTCFEARSASAGDAISARLGQQRDTSSMLLRSQKQHGKFHRGRIAWGNVRGIALLT